MHFTQHNSFDTEGSQASLALALPNRLSQPAPALLMTALSKLNEMTVGITQEGPYLVAPNLPAA